ncbi:YihY/virulence factor BrkB family protein [Geofilum rubicundum]|uniref:Ribonuclease BN n=1 Tax=Geofilum rubicundum JCM 15548 TaxID=1236989 RepID=A0A0E9LTX1_9BACT|nr:YihY/virulence factor BrkB family protein [Geofilum rubicundum]GAO28305.1 ribonuclease BN [Geofilum rubicundum JCM 15548]
MGLFNFKKNKKDERERFRIKHLPSLLKGTAKAWSQDDPWRHSAIVAYYAILALPGLMVIIITMLGYLWGTKSAEGRIYDEINSVMGQSAADSIQSIMENAAMGDSSLIATIIGIGALIFGATGVFFHLQISINKIWQVESDPKNQILRYLIDRSKSFGFVLVIGFLMLISFVISALLMALQQYLQQWFPSIIYHLFWIAELVISFGVITLLFALIFKYLPDVHIGWRSVWIGALITSFLFALGKEVLSFYFGQSNPGSVYGAAGSLIIILLWVSYSCLILFFGAEFTWIYTKRYGIKFRPKSYAKFEPKEG